MAAGFIYGTNATQVLTSVAHGGAQRVGDIITFTLVTDAKVAATGVPRLILSNGGVAAYSGVDALGRPQFTYKVAAGQDIANLAIAGFDAKAGALLGPQARTSFAGAASVDVGSASVSVAAADLNGDGRLDLVTANPFAGTVAVRLGAGNGTFTNAPNGATANQPSAAIALDVNGDRKLDLVTANTGGDTILVSQGKGDGTFGATLSYATGSGPNIMRVGDMDGNGRLDLLVANGSGGSVSVLRNDGAGFSSTLLVPVGDQPEDLVVYGLATGDVNRDGKLDFLAATYDVVNSTYAVAVRLGAGDGTFTKGTAIAMAGSAGALATGDVNGDGKLDLLVADFSGNAVLVRLGAGNGMFTSAANVAVGKAPTALAATDVNGDGKLDLITANQEGGTVSVRLGTGKGTFTATPDIKVADTPSSVTTGDVNGDGKPDLIVGSAGTSAVSVVLNTSVTAAPFNPSSLATAAGKATGFAVDTRAPAAPMIAAPAAGGRLEDNTPEIRGSAEAGSMVSIYVDGAVAGATRALSNGTWSFTVPKALSEGAHGFRAIAKDGAGNTSGLSRDAQVVVDAINDAPRITSNKGSTKAGLSVAENKKALPPLKAADPNGDALSWSLAGKDAKLFSINGKTGQLAFKTAPDFETPKDSGRNNTYDVTVKVWDGQAGDTQALRIKVADVKGISKSGTKKADTLTGTLEADVLKGLAGNDTLRGMGGNDKLFGGLGADKLFGGSAKGGSGFDTFVFASVAESTVKAAGRDTIHDFARGDHIDLKAIDASTKAWGNQAFTFIGTDKFSGKAGELRYDKLKSDAYVYADTNGDKRADFAIHFDDAVRFVKGDFLL